ncbi:MAG: hypothetical protein MR982_00645 [Bacteroides pyogenes]|uniref:hypothetical protein n=1 Tax=Bacteroides pyogenes TaxID=310300 RepID=UPI002432F251|nr:hypothetical protein [Bacteroides pyogenes]MCI7069484.1 hypothetical protein [Bacteroides pyogenes]MDY5354187.1 hypothetical protein [Bacteroides pyogenes]
MKFYLLQNQAEHDSHACRVCTDVRFYVLQIEMQHGRYAWRVCNGVRFYVLQNQTGCLKGRINFSSEQIFHNKLAGQTERRLTGFGME